MKLQRLRFILLCLLLLCLVSGMGTMTCETEYIDAASKAYLAEIVLIAKFNQKLQVGSTDSSYNATVKVENKRSILKGGDLLKNVLNRRGATLLTVGMIGTTDPENCVAELEKEPEYMLFLSRTTDSDYFRIFAMPVSGNNKRGFKKAKRDVKKILCKSGNCVKLPVINPRKMKSQELKIGEKLELSCKLKGKTFPNPSIKWLKDGVDINISNSKASIRGSKRGSRLRIKKAEESDAGTYVCVAKNVGGEVRQEAVITVLSNGGAARPEVSSRPLRDKKQQFGEKLSLKCRIKSETSPRTEFTWYKNGKEITSNTDRLTIENRKEYSRLEISNTLLGDAANYKCIAKNTNGEVIQSSNISVIGAPKKIVDCSEGEAHFCLNGGVCRKYVELDEKFCTCEEGYRGTRCDVFVPTGIFKKSAEDTNKLARDRTFVVVGIISGILLFIGICVVSYFLAKRRRDRFHMRQGQRANRNIEDNIPQVYRPLIGCDDIDGLTKKMNGVLIHKEVQTTETCFLTSDKANLYINPLETYVNETGDRNSRSRKAAVSLERDPRTKHTGSDSDEENTGKYNNRHVTPVLRDKPVNTANRHSNNGLNFDGAPNDSMNDLSPKRKPMQQENDKHVGAKPNVVNIPSPKSTQPPAINLDSDSEEEDFPEDGTPLTPLHISEGDDEDNAFIFKMCRIKRNSSSNDTKQENVARTKTKDLQKGPAPKGPAPKPRPENNNSVKEPQRVSLSEAKDNKRARPSREEPKHSKNKPRPRSHESKDNNNKPRSHRSERNEPKDNTKARPSVHEPKHSNNKETKALTSPGNISLTTTSENVDSDSSSTTEGCDSPNTLWLNAQEEDEFSDHRPHHPVEAPATAWNERGSPEPTSEQPNYFNVFPKMETRHTGASDRNDRNRNQMKSDRGSDSGRAKLKNKFTIAI